MRLKIIKLKFKRVISLKNEYGFKNFLKIIINYIFNQFIAIGYILKGELSDIKYVPENKDIEFRAINKSDLDIMSKNYQTEFNEKEYNELIFNLNEKNIDCFIVKKDENICGYFSLAYGKSESEIEKKYLNVEKNGYIFGDYVFEKYRGKKIQQFSAYKRFCLLKEKKFETATCIIKRENIPSIRTYEKFGFQKYLIKYHFRFGNLLRSKDYYKIVK
jgi:ribosomal protein S18 acetylase RimI-like enzyme